MKCPLCGKEFSTEGGSASGGEYSRSVCAACPFHKGCELIKCPNCGYQFPRESKIISLIRKMLRILKGEGARRKMQCPEEI